jgi:hypothetical protein
MAAGTTQQSSPAWQHDEPQQVAAQSWPAHGGVPHVPWSQKGLGPGQTLPQVPQLRMSFWWFTHTEPQQASPKAQLEALQAPELELVLLLVLLAVVP